MTPDRWQQIKHVLDEVLQCPPDEQASLLEALCEDNTSLRVDVESFLEAEANAPSFLDDDAAKLGAQLLGDLAPVDLVGRADQIGPYRLVEEMGSGGMGIVYRAERADGHFEQEVALKVVPRYFGTDERVARFRAERQILASLNHSNIARLLDGGVTPAGHPYLVMECIDGKPITEYCAEHKVSLRDRLRMLQTVGRAVHHAHSNLVVHRDLKPSNILVTETGMVKLLDFGIAKLLNPERMPSPPPITGGSQLLMTPEYAAPEQVRGEDVTTATDVYQLGVLAYELLVEARPFHIERRRLPEIEQTVLQTRPPPPSTAIVQRRTHRSESLPQSATQWSQRLQGDVDDIVMKALRKEPGRRYASVTALVDDLDRFLNNRPIRARPATVGYRIRKFALRNRGHLLASLTGLLLLVGVTLFYTVQIQTERDRAQAEAQKSEEVTSFLMDLFEANAPTETLGEAVTAEALLARGLNRADALDDQPSVQAQMFDVVGQIYGRLGNYDQAETALRRAVQIRARVHGSKAQETIESREHLGVLLGDAGQYELAEQILRDVLTIRDNDLTDDALPLAETKRHLAYVLRRQGKYEETKTLLEESLPIVESHLGEQSQEAVATKSSLGVVFQNLGHYEKAEALYRSVLDERRRRLTPPHPKLAMSINSLASLLMNVGLLTEAETLFEESLRMREELFGANHPKVALTINNLALVHRHLEHYDEAEALYRRSLSIRRSQMGDEHLSVAISLYGLAGLLHRTNRLQSALDAYQEALERFTEHLGPKHSFVARARMGIGSVYHDLGNHERARELLREGFDQVRRIHSESSLEYALEAGRFGRFHLEQNNDAQADSLLRKSLSTLQAIEKSTTPRQRKIERHVQRLSENPTGNTALSFD